MADSGQAAETRRSDGAAANSEIAAAFADGPAFIPYLAVGDPSYEASKEYVEALARGGADVIELGLPFSEPIAEGPTIQGAIVRALEGGMTPELFFEFVEDVGVDVPLVYMTPAETGIESPHDFPGNTVALSPGQGTYLYEAIMGVLDIDRSQVNEIDMPSWDVVECWESADVCPGYAISDIPYAEHEDIPVQAIWPGEYGVPFYGDVLFTTDTFVEENPDVVQRFVRATLKGWQKAIETPELAADAVMAFASDADRELELESVETSIPLIDTGDGQIGRMSEDVWIEMHDVLLDRGLIEEPVNVSTVYTNEFVENVQP